MSEIYFVAAFFVLGLTTFQGYLGGELVFKDGVGVERTGQGTKSPQKSQGSDTTAADDGGGHQH